MQLYITPGSPYARIVRMMILERGLENRVETVVARTRVADSPYYQINPSGRVPFLVRDKGVGLEESAVICAYLDRLDGKPTYDLPDGERGWEVRRLGALATSLLDGLSVWGREVMRPNGEQSPTVIAHETERSRRMIDLWEAEIAVPWMQQGDPNLEQITLACALGLEARNRDFRWRAGHPRLVDWFERIGARPSFVATAP
jgi:glutathione S-transferase